MKRFLKSLVFCFPITIVALVFLTAGSLQAGEPDWGKIPERKITAFKPGQASWEFVVGAGHGTGAKAVQKGEERCLDCHKGEEAELVKNILGPKKLDPEPVKGHTTKEVSLKAAYDNENIYVRLEWASAGTGIFPQDMFRYNGKEWELIVGERPGTPVEDLTAEDRVNIMWDDGSVPGFKKYGCWLTCHNDLVDMPNEIGDEIKNKNPYFVKKKKNIKEITKYLLLTTTKSDATGGWMNINGSDEELDKLKKEGKFIDLWHWKAGRSGPQGYAQDQHIFVDRASDKGKGPYTANWDKEKKQPKFMFNKAKLGYNGFEWGDVIKIQTRKKNVPAYLLTTDTSVPFDPNAGWKKGDTLPGFTNDIPLEGGADIKAKGVWKDGKWTVVMTRKLNTGDALGDKVLKDGGVYTIGTSVHDDFVGGRWHYVSFPFDIGLGAKADYTATKVQ
ncbi:MAG: hypothetical protein HZC45_00555 [Deltaproteobacteria bacterium]|nr:hypothetical protein [Deltaproteobacteria bacterium]